MIMKQDRQEKIRQLLDHERDRLEPDRELSARLAQARSTALRSRKSWIKQHTPAIGLAAAAVLLMVVALPYLSPENGAIPPDMTHLAPQEMELISQLEDFEQDLEFYYWLEEQDASSG